MRMKKSKLLLPITCLVLVTILAVLIIMPVNIYAFKETPGAGFWFYGLFICCCGGGSTCICVTPEEPQ